MSLINQMLKDLEQRGAGDPEVIISGTEKAMTSKFDNIQPMPSQLPNKLPLMKIAVVLALLASTAYYWIQHGLDKNESYKADIANIKESQDIIYAPADLKVSEAAKTDDASITAQKSDMTKMNESGNIDSEPLFVTELKFQPIATKAHKSTNNIEPNKPLTIETTQVNATALVESAKQNLQEKNLTVNQQTVKSATKLNFGNATGGKLITADQKSANYFRLAISNLQQGRVAEAQAHLTLALEAKPANQEARQTLAGLLLDNKRNDEARAILTTGLAIAPEQSDFRMAIARLQVESGDHAGALNTLEEGLSNAKGNADYQGFLATLLQRVERHEEAINHYMTALSLNSNSTSALIGLGISLQAVGKFENAQEAFTRAQSAKTLSLELSKFVDQQLKVINQHINN
ncbi:MAG: tetratricopeptide repeat protein [Methylotenera sp.]|nr:tetratricopeptide repeat protein [Methylotenera sp.]